MKIRELYDFLSKYIGEGKGETAVVVCKFGDNPLSDGRTVSDVAFIEWKDGDCFLMLEFCGRKDGRMTEFVSRKYGDEGYENIIKTDSEEHYKATVAFARHLIDHAELQTVADKIRAMSDRELASFFADKVIALTNNILGGECEKLKVIQIERTKCWVMDYILQVLRTPADETMLFYTSSTAGGPPSSSREGY